MSDAAIINGVRRRARFLVEREERITGSRMLAYERIASAVGASADWLRYFIAGNDKAKCPNFVVGTNIFCLYQSWCERVDEKMADERGAIEALKAEINAATPKALATLAASSREKTAGENQT